MSGESFLDLNYIPRYVSSSHKRFAPGERHVTRFGTQNVLLLVLDGVLRFEENGKTVELKGGEYYIQVMGKHQSGEAPSEEPDYLFFNFSGRFTKKERRGLPLRGSFDVERVEAIYTRLKACERTLKEKEDLGALFERQVIFFDLLNLLYKKSVSLVQRQEVATRIYEYIHLNFSKKITLEELSKQFGYSKDHIIRLFKSNYMTTPYQHLAYCRICHAKLLLSTEPMMSVSAIASACGYDDYTAFYHAFLHAEGISPSVYRERVRGTP